MAGNLITGTDVSGLTDLPPGKSQRLTWYNATAARWDGLFPDNTDDWFIVTDVGGTEANTLELDDRSSSQPSIFWDNTTDKLYVLSAHDTAFEFWTVVYTGGAYTLTGGQGAERAGVAVSGFGRAQRDEGHAITVTPNGNIWIFQMQENDVLRFRHSTDDGATWNTLTTLQSSQTFGSVDAFWFANAGTNYVCVYGTEDATGVSATDYFFYIDEDHATPTTGSNWTDDSANIPAFDAGGQEADNHCCMCKDSNENIYIAVKRGEGTNRNDTKMLKRTPGGTWSVTEVFTDGDAPGSTDYTRPACAVRKITESNNEELIVAAGHTGGSSQIAVYKTSPLDTISWSTTTTIFEDTVGSDTFTRLFAPCNGTVYDGNSDCLFIAINNTDSTFWENKLLTDPPVDGGLPGSLSLLGVGT